MFQNNLIDAAKKYEEKQKDLKLAKRNWAKLRIEPNKKWFDFKLKKILELVILVPK